MTMQHPFTGEELKQGGMTVAIAHADMFNEHWSDDAFDILKQFLMQHIGNFMTEEVREFADSQGLPKPPSLRAWGSIIAKAAKLNLIVCVGFKKVRNPRAHRANASVWCATNKGWAA